MHVNDMDFFPWVVREKENNLGASSRRDSGLRGLQSLAELQVLLGQYHLP